MHTNVKIGIGNASGLLIGGLSGYLVSRKLHKKTTDQIAHEIIEEVIPSIFQTMTMMFTGLQDMASLDFSEMTDEDATKIYEKMLSDRFEFFNLTMKEKYGISMQLEMPRESSGDE